MNNTQKEFLAKLDTLLNEYNVTIDYTNEDDGLHFYMNGDEFFVSYVDGERLTSDGQALD
jgi:hypothetical protein